MSKYNDKLSSLYRQASNEQPSEQVDNQILQLAKQQLTPNKPSVRKYLPYTMVASVALVALLVHNFPQHYLAPPQQEFEQPMSDPMPVKIESAPMAQPQQSSPAHWEYSDNSQTMETEDILPRQQAKKRLITPSAMKQRNVDFDTEIMRFEQLQRIKVALEAQDNNLALKEIAQYISDYSADSLPPKYLIIYQNRRNNKS